jgi:hypothetical protein
LSCVLLSTSSSPLLLLFSDVLIPYKVVFDDCGRCRVVAVALAAVVSHRTTTGDIRLVENASLTTIFVEIAIVNRNGIKGFTDDDDTALFIICHIIELLLMFRMSAYYL